MNRAKWNAIFGSIVYTLILVLVVCSVLLFSVVLCIAAIELIRISGGFIVITVVLGLFGLSLLMVYNVFRFLFISQPAPNDDLALLKITEQEEPKLFAMIQEVANGLGSKMPRSVYLVPHSTAFIRVESKIWHLIVPPKKDLIIGLQLINNVTELELKAVIAHELAHITQKDNRINVYNNRLFVTLGKILADENDKILNAIDEKSEEHAFLSFFNSIGKLITKWMKGCLTLSWPLIALPHFMLSREAEYRADDLSAKIAGPEPISQFLTRNSFIQSLEYRVFQFYNSQREKTVPENIYRDHNVLSNFMIQFYNLPTKNNLLDLVSAPTDFLYKSTLLIKNLYESHPDVSDRIKRLFTHHKDQPSIASNPANALLTNLIHYQVHFTSLLHGSGDHAEVIKLNSEDFLKAFIEQLPVWEKADFYHTYYSNYEISSFDLDTAKLERNTLTLDQLFGQSVVMATNQLTGLESELEILELLYKSSELKHFQYADKIYKITDAPIVLDEMKSKINRVKGTLNENDIRVFQFCFEQEKYHQLAPTIENAYLDFFEKRNILTEYNEVLKSIQKALATIGNRDYDNWHASFISIEEKEPLIKEKLRQLLEREKDRNHLSENDKSTVEKYISKKHVFYNGMVFNNDNFELLIESIRILREGYHNIALEAYTNLHIAQEKIVSLSLR
jgi:Zn-dependent protease with chaperone function